MAEKRSVKFQVHVTASFAKSLNAYQMSEMPVPVSSLLWVLIQDGAKKRGIKWKGGGR